MEEIKAENPIAEEEASEEQLKKKEAAAAHQAISESVDNIHVPTDIEEEIIADEEVEDPHTGPLQEAHMIGMDPVKKHLQELETKRRAEMKPEEKKYDPEDHPEVG